MNPFDHPAAGQVHDAASVIKAMRLRVETYLEDNFDGVAKNPHMNECHGHQPSDFRLRDTIEKYIERCEESPGFWGGDFHTGTILGKMSFIARMIAMNDDLDEVDRAIIVDFINYTGTTAGCDYGMKTSDLNE